MTATALCLACAARAQTTPAGTTIVNTARLTAVTPATAIDSNTVTLAIGEVIDAAIVADRATQPLSATIAAGFTIRNPGNAGGTFLVEGQAGDAVMRVAVDADDDGRVDAAELAAAVERPTVVLAAGASRRITVLAAGGATAPAIVAASVTAARGHGAPGTSLDDGTVIGTTGARAQASTRLLSDDAAGSLEKVQAVRAPDGSTHAVPGAVITYTLVARFARGCGDAQVADQIPEGTAFVPGSITVDGRATTDAADGDVAQLDAGRVRVLLGDVPAGAIRTVTFQAVIQ